MTIVATGSVALDTATAGAREQAPSVADGAASVVEVPVLAIARGGADWEYALSLQQLAYALAQQPLTDTETVPAPVPPVP